MNNNYSFLAKLFHWGFVFLFIYGVAKQVDDLEQLSDKFFFIFEITFATLFLMLLIVRYIYMKRTQTSSLPPDTSNSQKIAAKIVHLSMYILLASTALSGLLIGFLYHLKIQDGILINTVIWLHEMIINLLYIFIIIHILAASYHRLKKDGVWASMVPFFKEKIK
tara:strand:- start:979 stop:1473 length:495 start_codon:yes stop_codon:yes gene_type:complete